ncbi:DinB family protein [Bacillus sp. FJAT-27445]|uniref:DinB family protein n=1 Tax=Bacillus sp. FJAT-27445 TaxID=1679166 RepID=UPI000743C8CC|nr:DinB family protein [Bacillus sp. FJAT-27445]
MEALFRYNWMVREEWYRWCEGLSEEELLAERTGGVGGILKTLFHIIDVEWSWIRIIQGKPDFQEKFEDFNTLQKVRELDAKFRVEVEEFVRNWDSSMENNLHQETEPDGRVVTDTWGEVVRHVIVHEVHHIGQLSVWARKIGKKPVSANFIGRRLLPVNPIEQ